MVRATMHHFPSVCWSSVIGPKIKLALIHYKANAASLTLHVHSRYTAGALHFKLGPNEGRWAHSNVKLNF